MRFPKLHLRDLFWLVLVVGLVLGWWLDRENVREQGDKDRLEISRKAVHSVVENSRNLAESLDLQGIDVSVRSDGSFWVHQNGLREKKIAPIPVSIP